MTAISTTYFDAAHYEAKKSMPNFLKQIWIRILDFTRNTFVSKQAKTITKPKEGFIERFFNRLVTRISNDFVTISLELQAIHDRLINGGLVVENPNEEYETTKKIIKLLTHADNLFSKINYFDSEILKTELKNSLNTTYLIEVELKRLLFKDKKVKREKDDLFEALSLKSKKSLSRAF